MHPSAAPSKSRLGIQRVDELPLEAELALASDAHEAIDDRSRLVYSEIVTDEKKETAAGFWERANAFYAAHGITVLRVMTDNGSCYRSRFFNDALGGIKHKFTRPYRPQTNGKIHSLEPECEVLRNSRIGPPSSFAREQSRGSSRVSSQGRSPSTCSSLRDLQRRAPLLLSAPLTTSAAVPGSDRPRVPIRGAG